MTFNSPTTELTTAATDAILGIVCLFLIVRLRPFLTRSWRAVLWSWVFGLLGIASFLGSVAHGLELSSSFRYALWQPLYLALGIDVALFVVGAVFDLRGENAARRLPWLATAAGLGFYIVTVLLDGSFLVFVIYEGAAMVSSMAIYIAIGLCRRVPGAWIIAGSVGLNIAAAILQAGSYRLTLAVPFDHNGIFHLVQIPAVLMLSYGLHAGFGTAGRVHAGLPHAAN